MPATFIGRKVELKADVPQQLAAGGSVALQKQIVINANGNQIYLGDESVSPGEGFLLTAEMLPMFLVDEVLYAVSAVDCTIYVLASQKA